MWGRSARQVVVCTTVVSLFFFSLRLLSSVSSSHLWIQGKVKEVYEKLSGSVQLSYDEQIPSEHTAGGLSDQELTDEQMRVLRAFNPFATRDEKPQEVPESPSKVRSDALIGGLQKICENFNVTIPLTAFMLAHMHFDQKRQAIYCFTPKVACTSWKRIWMKMTGLVKPEKDLAQLSRYTIHSSIPTMASLREKVPEMLAKYKKFMFVRHPFDRVLSAYKDKLEHEDKESSYNFHKEIGARIQRKYR